MHAPEKHSDAILWRLRKFQIPKEQLPIERITLGPERCAEQAAIGSIARRHESLQVMTGNQFMKDGGAREVNVVPTHAHHLLLVRHCVRRKRDQDCFAAENEWT